jgi:hypothetical protein
MNVIIGLVLVGVCHWLNAWIQAVSKKELISRWNLSFWKKDNEHAGDAVRSHALNVLRFFHMFL